MIPRANGARLENDDRRPKWLNSPVTFHAGTLTEIRKCIPAFERRPFVLPPTGGETLRTNGRLETIVRLPFGEDKTVVPVGVVSKDYALAPHTAVLDATIEALHGVKIAPSDVRAELKITEYGERMALSLYLPDKYQYDPGDGYPMALRLECINSIDGSTRFRALMGWFRLVCSNGLVIGVTRFDIRRRHVGEFRIHDIGEVLSSGLSESEAEKRNFAQWRKTRITLEQLKPWIEDDLRKDWGFKAATRAFHIARTGADAEITGQYRDSTPTTIAVRLAKRVPGAPEKAGNLYDVSQILAWLARDRRDLQEQMEWREQIPALMASLN